MMKLQLFRRNHPNISTSLSALVLAMVWSGIWVMVFLVATAFLNLTTPTLIFVITLWFGVVAEAPIRWIENEKFTARWSKPLIKDADGDNKDYSSNRVLWFIVLFGLIPFFGFLSLMYFTGLTIEQLKLYGGEFIGPGSQPSPESFMNMLNSWYDAFTSKIGVIGFFACIFMRTLIYKRKVHGS